MLPAIKTLADSLSLAHAFWCHSLVDEATERAFALDWPRVSGYLSVAIRRSGGPVAWQGREPTGPADDTPFVIASVDESTGFVRFDSATAMQAREMASADQFDWRGDRID